MLMWQMPEIGLTKQLVYPPYATDIKLSHFAITCLLKIPWALTGLKSIRDSSGNNLVQAFKKGDVDFLLSPIPLALEV